MYFSSCLAKIYSSICFYVSNDISIIFVELFVVSNFSKFDLYWFQYLLTVFLSTPKVFASVIDKENFKMSNQHSKTNIKQQKPKIKSKNAWKNTNR